MTVGAHGSLAAADAWDRFVEPRRWPGWAPHLVAVRCDDARIRAGSRGTVRAIGGIVGRFEVDALDEARRRWSWTVRVGPLRIRFDHAVRAAPEGCGAWTRIRAPLPLAVLYAPLAGWAMRRLVRREGVARRAEH